MATPAAGTAQPGAVRDRGFHRLRVLRVVRETAEASSFVLGVPDHLRRTFAHEAGQFLTFRVPLGGEVHHRCYSMSSAPGVDDELQVTVKRVPGGLVSNWMIDELGPGDVVEASAPAGVFRLRPGVGDVVAFAAGSGITPVFSLVKAALATTGRRVRLHYANRDRDAVIFRSALDALARRYPERLDVVHHLDVERGLVEPRDVRAFVGDGPAVAGAEVYLCGPAPFMDLVERALLAHGVDAGRIHVERFTPAGPVAPAPPPGDGADRASSAARVTVELGGRTATIEHRPGTTILQVAREMGLSPPYSCESGTCATCMARLVEGSVRMQVNDVLTDDEVAGGWVLTCQSVPTASAVHVVYEGS